MKKCSTCKVEKELAEFNKNKIRSDGYSNQCKLCIKQYRISNIEKIKQYNKQHYLDNIEYSKQYYLDNYSKLNQQNKEYRQSPQGKLVCKAKDQKRRALKKSNTPSGKHWKPKDVILKLKLQNNRCVYCNINIANCYEVEHFIPISKGGSNEPSNIQLLCQNCNRGKDGKHTKLPHEFAKQHNMLF